MTRNKAALLVGVAAALAASLLLPASLSAQPDRCPSLTDTHAIGHNQRVVAAERDGVATLDFSAKYAGDTATIQGVLCDPQGHPLAGTQVQLVAFSVRADAKLPASSDGRPSVEELRYANGDPYSVLGTQTAVTSQDGRFRFIGVGAGKMALEVSWGDLPSLPFVTWNVTWEPGPVMIVGRDFQ